MEKRRRRRLRKKGTDGFPRQTTVTDDPWAKRDTLARAKRTIIRYALPYRELDPFQSRARVWQTEILPSAFSFPAVFFLTILHFIEIR